MAEDRKDSEQQPTPLSPEVAAKFVELLTSHQRQLFAYISTLLVGDAAAADVLQETNVDLWTRSGSFDFDRPFLPWAFAFARNRVLAHRKTQSRSRLLYSDSALARIEQECSTLVGEADSRLFALQDCLKKLNPSQSRMIRERYFGRSSVRMMAARMGETAQNVSSQLYRIRRQLAKCVEFSLVQEASK